MRRQLFNTCKIGFFSLLIGLSNFVWAEDKPEEQIKSEGASEPEQLIWYACPLQNNHVSYTTSPLDVNCQVAKHPPADASDIKARSLDRVNIPRLEELQRLWYSAEFGRDGDLMKVPPTPKLGVHLRQQETNKNFGKYPNKNVVIPAKIIVPPKLTPKQLVQRDINSEQRALAIAQKKLDLAKKRGVAVQIQKWQQNVTDRLTNIRVLKQELSRY